MNETEMRALADQSDKLQKVKNSGRGVNCVEDIIIYLRSNRPHLSKAICWNEGDKISSYPDILKLLKKTLMKDEKGWYWSCPTD